MHRFPSIQQTVPSNCLAYSLIYSQRHIHVLLNMSNRNCISSIICSSIYFRIVYYNDKKTNLAFIKTINKRIDIPTLLDVRTYGDRLLIVLIKARCVFLSL